MPGDPQPDLGTASDWVFDDQAVVDISTCPDCGSELHWHPLEELRQSGMDITARVLELIAIGATTDAHLARGAWVCGGWPVHVGVATRPMRRAG